MKDICDVYLITNKINGQQYVGQTWTKLSYRFRQHCNEKRNYYITNAINKYGKDNFTIEAVCYAIDQKDADYWEGHFIKKYDTTNNGYNIRAGGNTATFSPTTRK